MATETNVSAEIVCCCYGWERESWGGAYPRGTYRCYANQRLFWWWSIDRIPGRLVVDDGDPEPRFIIPENLPFRVVECSKNHITFSK